MGDSPKILVNRSYHYKKMLPLFIKLLLAKIDRWINGGSTARSKMVYIAIFM
jgi:hypothetical protein